MKKQKNQKEVKWYQEPELVWFVLAIVILTLLSFGIYFNEKKTNEPIYKETPCYYLSDPETGQLVGINESDYSKIKILTDSKNSSRFTVLDTRNESNIKEIPLCELWK